MSVSIASCSEVGPEAAGGYSQGSQNPGTASRSETKLTNLSKMRRLCRSGMKAVPRPIRSSMLIRWTMQWKPNRRSWKLAVRSGCMSACEKVRQSNETTKAERADRDRNTPMPGRSSCVPINGTTSAASIPSSASSVSHRRILLFRLASPAFSTRQRPVCSRPSITASRQL